MEGALVEVWCSGNTTASKAANRGSIPRASAKRKVIYGH